MKQVSRITLLAILLSFSSAFADGDKAQAPAEITELQVRQAISLLIEAGVLKVDGSKVLVDNPSILDELTRQGRVDMYHASPGSICAKNEE